MQKGKLIYIKKPGFDELNYIQKLWVDEKTMKDVVGAYVRLVFLRIWWTSYVG